MPESLDKKRLELKRRLLKQKLEENGQARPKPKEENLFKSAGETLSDFSTKFDEGAAFGFGDEISGASGAALDTLFGRNPDKSLIEKYRHYRDAARGDQAAAAKRSPVASTVGSIAGGLIVPSPAGKASIPSKLKSLTGGGALAGAGYSEADATKGELHRLGYDASMGGLTGAAFGAGTSALSKTPNLAGAVGKKGIRAVLGVGEDSVDRYIKRPAQVNASRGLEELVDEVKGNVSKLKQKVIKGSKDAVGKIPDSRRVSANKIKGNITAAIKNQEKKITPESDANIAYLKKLLKNFDEKTKDYFKTAEGKKQPKGFIPAKKVKDFVKELDENTTYGGNTGSFDKARDMAKKTVRKDLDKYLKDIPEYKEAMKGVSREASLLNEASKIFGGSESNVASKLKSVAQRPEQRLTESRVLGSLDDVLKTKLSDENVDRLVREAFEKTHTQGSRNTLMGALGGAALGGGAASAVTGPLGAAFGYLVDKYGPKMAKGILDKYIKMQPRLEKIRNVTDKTLDRTNVPQGLLNEYLSSKGE